MLKNTSGQKILFLAIDTTTGDPLAGDAANITAYVSIDYGSLTALADTSATELSATNAKGVYSFDLAQAETNGHALLFTAKSATAHVWLQSLPGGMIYTVPAAFNTVPGAAGGLFIAGTNEAVTITTATGPALTLSSTGGNGAGLSISGNGTGNGVLIVGGDTADGLKSFGGATSGNGASFTAITLGHGVSAAGAGTAKHGLKAAGGGTGGHGVLGVGSTAGSGFSGTGGTTGAGASFTGGTTGPGLSLVGGSTSGDGMLVTTTSGNGFTITPTAGHAIAATANGTSKHGFVITGGTAGTSDGLKCVAGTGGVAVNGGVKLTSDGLDAVIVMTSGGTLNARQGLAAVVVGLGTTTGNGTTTVTAAAPAIASPGTPGWAFTLNAGGDHTAATFTPPA